MLFLDLAAAPLLLSLCWRSKTQLSTVGTHPVFSLKRQISVTCNCEGRRLRKSGGWKALSCINALHVRLREPWHPSGSIHLNACSATCAPKRALRCASFGTSCLQHSLFSVPVQTQSQGSGLFPYQSKSKDKVPASCVVYLVFFVIQCGAKSSHVL